MNRRHEQRASTIERAVQEVLARGIADPRVRGLITVTGIKLSDDGAHAAVSVSILPADRQELTMHGLRAATAHIRREVMARIRIREMPRLEFRLDESIKQQGEVLAAINRAAEERERRAVEPGGPGANDENGPGDAARDTPDGVGSRNGDDDVEA